MPQYADNTSTEAFERMFERDKDELRELGIPLVTSNDDALFEDEIGYRVDREAYALPQVVFEPDELAVLGLASRVWQQASLAAPATRAPDQAHRARRAAGRRLADRSRAADPHRRAGVRRRCGPPLRDRVPVRFTYRTARHRRGRRARRSSRGASPAATAAGT